MSFAYDSAFQSVPERRTAISSSIQRLAMHFKGYFRVRRNSVFAMTQDLIRYDILAQDALRGVIKTVLHRVAAEGLPGEHHFYISFATTAPGVRISKRLLETYPEEMTIVLQHQFWELEVKEHAFFVGLSFNGVPEKLHVPFSAVKRFFDPFVQFGLEFEVGKLEAPNQIAEKPDEAAGTAPETAGPAEASQPETDSENGADGSADVVSLDSFRRKK